MNDPMQSPPPGPPQAPIYNPPSGGGTPVPDYMVFAILSTVLGTLFNLMACCCLPVALGTGIFAIVQANKAKAFAAAGNSMDGLKAASQAKIWSIVTAVIGVLCLLFWIASIIFQFALNPQMIQNMMN